MKKIVFTILAIAICTLASAFNIPPGKYYYDNSVTQWSAPQFICGNASSARQYAMSQIDSSDIWVYERPASSNTWSGATEAYFISDPIPSFPTTSITDATTAAAAAGISKSIKLTSSTVGQLLRPNNTFQLMDVFIKHAWNGSTTTYVAATKISDTEWQYEGLYGSGAFSVSTNDPTLGSAATGVGVYEVTITPTISGGALSLVDNVIVTYMTPQIVAQPAANHSLIIAKSDDNSLRVAFNSRPDPNQTIFTNTTMSFTAIASKPATLAIYLNDVKQQEIPNATEITQSVTFTQAGTYTIKVTATDSAETVLDQIPLNVLAAPVEVPRPAGTRYGINYIDDNTVTLVLYAPRKQYVCAVGDFNNWTVSNDYMMNKDGDTWWITLTGLEKGREYAFYYNVDGLFNVGDPYTNKVLDKANDGYIPTSTYPNLRPFPSGATGSNMVSVFQTGQTPYNWQVPDFKGARQDQLIIYELLIRDFTQVGNGNGDLKTAMTHLDYLKSLGINAIELMPFNEFDGNNSWGYNPAFYFAPDKAYGTSDDFKQFVDECHKRGIAVIQDLVLNHSYGQSPFIRLYASPAGSTGAKPASDNPWYNVTSPHTCYSWGADFNHASPQTQALVDSICSFWMSQYKIDGFRFDFTKGFTNTPTNSSNNCGSNYDASRIAILKRMYDQIKKRKSNAYVILEHFCDATEEKELGNYGMMIWAKANNEFCQSGMAVSTSSSFSGILAKQAGWSYDNKVGYMESHDEERVAYKVRTFSNLATSKPTTLERQMNQIALNAAFFLTLPGPKMLEQFGELGYDYSITSKRGVDTLNTNFRTDPKVVRWDYYNVPERKELYDTYAKLLYFRNTYANSITNGTLTANITVSDWPIRKVKVNDSAISFLLIGNFDATAQQTVATGLTGTWYDLMTGETANTSLLTLPAGQFKILTSIPVVFTGVDITTIDKESINVYPNPVTDNLYISGGDAKMIEITAINGVCLLKQPIVEKRVSLETLPSGIYIGKITLSNGSIKIIKISKL